MIVDIGLIVKIIKKMYGSGRILKDVFDLITESEYIEVTNLNISS